MEVDFLVVGQGIAGTVLSYRLMQAGKKTYVVDLADGNNCSRTAAGLYNPVTGRKMTKTWLADQIFPEIEPFYQGLEETLKAKFIYSRPMYRPFCSIEEQNEWMGKSSDQSYAPYIQNIYTSSRYKEVHDPFGGLLLMQTGYLDANTMMDSYAAWLDEKSMLSNERLDEEVLVVSKDRVLYKNITARSLVFANGLGALNSKYFDWLPLIPNKGEILVIQQQFNPSEVINRGVFRITLPDNRLKVGSTYSNKDVSDLPTESAKEELLEKLGKLIKVPVDDILEHKTGIRPTTGDRKPILGKHPNYDNVYIFNGLGAKGVSLAPYFSKIMLDLLVFGKEPAKEVNISRFFKYI